MLFFAPNTTAFDACALLMLSLSFCASTFVVPVPQELPTPQIFQGSQKSVTTTTGSTNQERTMTPSPADRDSRNSVNLPVYTVSAESSSSPSVNQAEEVRDPIHLKLENILIGSKVKYDEDSHRLAAIEDTQTILTHFAAAEFEGGDKWKATAETVDGLDELEQNELFEYTYKITVVKGKPKAGGSSASGSPAGVPSVGGPYFGEMRQEYSKQGNREGTKLRLQTKLETPHITFVPSLYPHELVVLISQTQSILPLRVDHCKLVATAVARDFRWTESEQCSA
ncbi:hypothetical protein FB446DRAFT_789354 [Lentinula raphanica]|nr:hypothetical protein FB446DRAFT_789354 [Lentinula raphanica]